MLDFAAMEYVISRPELPESSEELSADLYFNLWEKKNWPYSKLQQGDILYWYEVHRKCIVWKSRTIEVERFSYKDKNHLRKTLESLFGAYKENHPYVTHASGSGYCLAYKIEPLRKLNIPKPKDIPFPRLGWLETSDPLAKEWLSGFEDKQSSATPSHTNKDFRKTFHSKTGAVRYWWVNQNRTYNAEVPGGFLWSPKTRVDGGRNQFYENMRLVEEGDVVFSFRAAHIKAIGVATGRAEPAPKPDFGKAGGSWSNEGWLVPVEFRELDKPFRPKDHIEQLRPHLPAKYSPLQESGDGLQSVYLAEIPNIFAAQLIALLGDSYRKALLELEGFTDTDSSANTQEEAIRGRTDIGATTKAQLVLARRGQGIFRANVRLNESACRITGVTDPKHLRASHIKPWSKSTDEEKLNGCNGLLLSPHIDHLFDNGFISFANNGELMIASQLNPQILSAWGIPKVKNAGKFNEQQAVFMEYHRSNIFKESTDA